MSSPESQGVSKYKNAPSSSPGICGQGWFPPTRSFNHNPCQTFEISHRLLLASAFEMRIATLASVTTYLWAAAMMTVAQPVGDENTDSSPAALKLPRDVAGGWWWDQKPTGTKDRPHKCLHRPCETACKLWAVALSLGISCGKLPLRFFFFFLLRGEDL